MNESLLTEGETNEVEVGTTYLVTIIEVEEEESDHFSDRREVSGRVNRRGTLKRNSSKSVRVTIGLIEGKRETRRHCKLYVVITV